MSNLILRPSNFSELASFANMAAKSRMVPTAMQGKPEDIMLAVQMGSELGLAPMQSVQNIAVINGRPAVWGDALIGLCRASPQCEDIQETMEGDGDNMAAICVAKRRGASAVVGRFSVADAKKAGLWGKQGPWQQYPTRMLQLRARGFALRDAFPDVLRGIISAEEARDMPTEAPYSGPTVDGTAESVTPPPEPAAKPKWQQIVDAFRAVATAEEYYAVIDAEGERIAWLKTNKPEQFAEVDAARAKAAAVMQDTPDAVDEAAP